MAIWMLEFVHIALCIPIAKLKESNISSLKYGGLYYWQLAELT